MKTNVDVISSVIIIYFHMKRKNNNCTCVDDEFTLALFAILRL